MNISITSLLAAAVRIHDAERNLVPWEVGVRMLTDEIPSATPERFTRICRELDIMAIGVDCDYGIHIASQAEMRARDASGENAEMVGVLQDQHARNQEVGERLLQLRKRMRATHTILSARIADLRWMKIDECIMSVLPKDGAHATRSEIIAGVALFHETVTDAYCAWRSMGETLHRSFFFTSRSNTDAEIDAALHVLLGRRLVVRHRSFAGTRWSLAMADRKAA